MRWRQKLRLRSRSMFWRGRVERELDEELRFHMEQQIAENLAAGMTADEARHAARRSVGGVEQIKEDCRDMRRVNYFENVIQDVRYAGRILSKNPGFTAVIVLTLALGIGANTAIFSIFDVFLLRMLPVKDPERLVIVSRPDKIQGGFNAFRYSAFEHLRDHNSVLSGIFGITMPERTAATIDGQAELVQAQIVSGGYYSTLGVNAVLGRTITAEDDRIPETSSVAVISYAYWKRRFNSAPNVIGTKITINGFPFTIIGVTRPEFFGLMYGYSPDVTAPMSMQSVLTGRVHILNNRKDWFVESIGGRLKPGISEEQARANLDLAFQQTLAFEDRTREMQLQVVPGSKGFWQLRERLSTPLMILMAMVGLVLLIACANVANLLMARGTARRKEIAMRLALGASRPRLVRQMLTECVLLGMLGGAAGLLFASWIGHLLLVLVSSAPFPISFDFRLDSRILAFTGGVSILVGILFGLVPVARATKVNLTADLKATSACPGRGRTGIDLSKVLIVAQVAVSLLLLVGAGLFVRTLRNLKDLYPGFSAERLLVFSVEPTLVGYQDNRLRNLYKEILERVKSTPDVRAVSLSRYGELTLGGLATREISVPGYVPPSNETPEVKMDLVGPNFFRTMGMVLPRGRDFTPQDGENGRKVAVINETVARRYFGDADPIGRHITLSDTPGDVELIGVVTDAKYQSLREHDVAMVFLPFLQFPPDHLPRMTYEVRSSGNPASVVAAIRKEIQAIDSNVPIYDFKTLGEQTTQSLMPERLVATLASLFGLLALALACVGLYGIMSHSVARRTQEIGIRMALGAHKPKVLTLVVGQGMLPALIGVGVGLVGASGVTRILSSLLYGVSATDPITFIVVSLMLIGVSFAACYIPARRAAKVDPMVALRYE
jgi:predicted permease